jgi:Family of unknown function (DUF5677)
MLPDKEQNNEHEFIKLAVKLLFQHMQDGKVTLAPHLMAKLAPAMDAVKFDDEGYPMLETVQPIVLSLAKTTAWMEQERLSQEREGKSEIHGILPSRIDVSAATLADRTSAGGQELDKLAFELYKETAGVLIVCASSLISYEDPAELSFNRNQAICIGLLVRIVKFMRATLAILSHGDHLGEVILALLRCIGESAINVRYLILKNDDSLFDQYVKVSLGPEGEIYDMIKENIEKRKGELLPVEARMLASIERLCKVSGVKIEEVNRKHVEWGGTMRDRLKALGIEKLYAAVQRIPSHAIHGTWADLALHHLEVKSGGFSARFQDSPVDTRILAPICVFVLAAVKDYYERFLAPSPEARPLNTRIDDLIDRHERVNSAHEEWYHQNKKVVQGEEN